MKHALPLPAEQFPDNPEITDVGPIYDHSGATEIGAAKEVSIATYAPGWNSVLVDSDLAEETYATFGMQVRITFSDGRTITLAVPPADPHAS